MEEEDQLYPDDPEELKQLHPFICGAALNTNVSCLFVFYILINLSVIRLGFLSFTPFRV